MTHRRPLRIGLTGGIASGKSVVAGRFAQLGAAVIDADLIAREVVEPGTPLLAELLRRFGPSVLQRYGESLRRPDGSLERTLLRRLIFDDPAERRELEALLHPAIRARTEQLAQSAAGRYQIHVVPLLVETQGEKRFDRILVVDCTPEQQLARLQARDGTDAVQARAILAAQASRTARLSQADDVISNTGTPAQLASAVEALHRRYLQLATELNSGVDS